MTTLGEMIAYKKRKVRERREWLERRHSRNPRCRYCKNLTKLMPPGFDSTKAATCDSMHATLEHIIPQSKGGADNPSNWGLSCGACNFLKADMPERDFIALLRSEGVIV